MGGGGRGGKWEGKGKYRSVKRRISNTSKLGKEGERKKNREREWQGIKILGREVQLHTSHGNSTLLQLATSQPCLFHSYLLLYVQQTILLHNSASEGTADDITPSYTHTHTHKHTLQFLSLKITQCTHLLLAARLASLDWYI